MILEEMTPAVLRERLATLIDSRPEFETMLYMLGPQRILEWYHALAIPSETDLAALVPPVPPVGLRGMVAAPSQPVFLWTGLKDAEMCVGHLDRHVPTKPGHARATRILDFGCGCGRTTRFLQAMERLDVSGTDVNPALVEWCQHNLTGVKTSLNALAPPLPFASAHFDFVYSLSIFSHLSESSMQAWIDELARVTSDNGIVLLTTHGMPALEIICHSTVHQQMFRMTAAQAERIKAELPERRFLHLRYDADVLAVAHAGDDYGNTFVHDSYVSDVWARGAFDVIEFIPGGLRGWQDATILKRRARL